MGRILIVDDDRSFCQSLSILLTRHGCEVFTALTGREALEALSKESCDVVITDLKMEEMSGLDLLRRIRANFPEVEVILLTAFGSIPTAVEAIKAEAFDYVTKPYKNAELLVVVDKAIERRRLVAEVKYLREVFDYKYNFGAIIGQSTAMRKVCESISKIAAEDSPALITGASGTGKELVAKAIHDNSQRKASHFMAINCSSLPSEIVESELFGRVRGTSMKHGQSAVTGLISEADGGTIFVDDVADLPIYSQKRLLNVMKTGMITPIGADTPRAVNVRIIAATSRNLAPASEQGVFDKELYGKLASISIFLPTLAERGDDILLLAEHFVKKYTREFGKQPMSMTPEAARMLLKHTWPGNVRELDSAIKRTIALTNSTRIRPEDMVLVTEPAEGQHSLKLMSCGEKSASLEEKELEYIVSSLRENNWNYTKTSKQLGIGRTTLWRKMKKLREFEREAARTENVTK
jgi:DNA-binding NtrC family response regulator